MFLFVKIQTKVLQTTEDLARTAEIFDNTGFKLDELISAALIGILELVGLLADA